MFIDIGGGWQINLSQVARIHTIDSGGAGTMLKFYSPSNEHLGDFQAETPEQLTRVLDQLHCYGRMER
ncbi:hypothetical protein [Noviherbaspirillum aridicola]|uniref:Uncharacterized protein n=1 Tax=Noviherbaspirillum aridicola TaxID=2849687 RepID=A0ABQ4Q6Y2_9BURK|nr:hypothetical protein [Noviherbaspirillum aridicola]GIZ52796.1 hypothetical protein NCCP691_28100 [Noviherbaspirillum aridicola]